MTATAASPWRAELGATLHLAVPLVLANLIQMAVYAIDVVFVARLGAATLAASSLSVSLFGLLMWCLSGLVGATAPLIAAELGSRRHAVREVRRSVRMGLWISVGTGAVAMLVCALGEPILLATGQDAALSAQAGEYLRILMWAMIPSIMAAALRVFVSALGRAVYATVITLLALLVNALGNWLLVFGNWGFPALGLNGAGVSSVVASLFMLGAYVLATLFDPKLRRYHILGKWWRPEWRRLRAILGIGTPIMLTILAEAGLFSGAAFLMGRIGEDELAGHTIALQVAALAFQVPFGIAQATTIRVGLFHGRGDAAGIGRAGAVSLVLGIGFMSLTALLMVLFPRAILSLYVDVDAAHNAALVGFALQYLIFAAAFQLFDGAQAVAGGALRGLQDTRVPMAIAMAGYWIVGFGTAILLGFFTPLAGQGIWAGLAIGLVAVSILLLWRWHWRGRLGLVPTAA